MKSPFLYVTTVSLLLSLTKAETISLPLGWQPEGITRGKGNNLFVGNLRTGAVLRYNIHTERTNIIVPPFKRRNAVGLWLAGNNLVVAGGASLPSTPDPAGLFYVYNAKTGKEVVACRIPGAVLLNDVVVVKGKAYFSDSGAPHVVVVPLKTVRKCRFKTIPLPRVFRPEAGGTTGNGIEFFRGRILVTNYDGGSIYAVDQKGRKRARPLLPDGSVRGPDGLLVIQNRLFVVENARRRPVVSEWKLRVRPANGKLIAKKIRGYRNETFDAPATVAAIGDTLYVTNTQFATVGLEGDISEVPFTLTVIERR